MRGSLRKRGKKWSVIIYLGRDQHGKHRYKWFSHQTRHEAEKHLAQLLVQVQAGSVVPSTRLRLSAFLEQWLRDYVSGQLAPTTIATYTNAIRTHLVPALGHIPLQRLSAQTIQRYLSQKLTEAKSSSATVHQTYRILRESLGYAVKWGMLPRNPTEFVDPPRSTKPQMRVWDEEQVRLFLAEAKRSSKYYLLYLTAILTGMRQGELLGLRWADIDFTLGVASIRQTFLRIGKRRIFKEPKSGTSRRTVALPEVLVSEIRSLRDQQSKNRHLLGETYEDHDLVFCQPNGTPLHAHNIVRRDFRVIAERVGLPHIRFHDLRHSHATHLLKQGVHPKVVQERLGHSSPAFTMAVYSHVLPGMQQEAAQRLAVMLLDKT